MDTLSISSFLTQPRGLTNFISEIKNAQSKDEERMRVDKELANIRKKFSESSSLISYQKKKYIWKMCYIYMLGYEIDFGHVEIISLLGATKFTEKSVGYMALSLLIKPGDELMSLVINSMRNDLTSPLHWANTLALAAISNIGGTGLAEALAPEVQRLLVDSLEKGSSFYGLSPEQEARNRALTHKKAALCLLRLFRTNPDCVNLADWPRYIAKLLEDRELGVVISTMALLMSMVSTEPSHFEPLIPYIISILCRLCIVRNSASCDPNYLYYSTPSPWLQVRCLRFLTYYKVTDPQQVVLLNDALQEILGKIVSTPNNNKSNADHSILFEAVNLVISYGSMATHELRDAAHALLGRFIEVRDANIRYLGLDAMNRLAKLEGPASVQGHQAAVLMSLGDTDVSVRRRALDLLFLMSDASNAVDVVGELVSHLALADSSMKEELVVKIAILAEKFAAGDFKWYVDTMLQTVVLAGDFVAEAVWYRIVLIVTNHSEVHEYAAEKMMRSIKVNPHSHNVTAPVHDVTLALAAYLLGEVGVHICEKPGMSGFDQLGALHVHFPHASVRTKAILFTTYMKLMNLYPDITEEVQNIFRRYSTSCHLELQQRACEYLALPGVGTEIMETVLNTMPPYSIEKENSLMALHDESTEKPTTDRTAIQVQKELQNPTVQEEEVASSSSSSASSSNIGIGSQPVKPPKAQPAQDLLSLDDTDVAPPPPPSSSLTGAPSSSSSSSSSFSSSAGSSITPDKEAAVARALNMALVAPPGQKSTLYQDANVKITSSGDFRGHQARVSVQILNVNQLVEITGLNATITNSDALVIRKIDPAAKLGPGEEGVVQLAIDCMKPFADLPSIEVSFYVQGSKKMYPLKLPVIAPKFFEPITVDKATFMQRWKALEGSELQDIFVTSKTVDPALLSWVRGTMFPALKIGTIEGIDNATSVTGSCTFRTGTPGPDGALLQVGCLLRLEADVAGKRFRLTVRAKHALIATAVKNTFKHMLQ